MKRAILVTGVVAASVLVPIGVVGAAGSSFHYESASSGGSAIFTTCTAGLPAGTHCDAWVINASKAKGTDGRSSTVSAYVYDVEITEFGFNPVGRGGGSAEGAIAIDAKLRTGSASAKVPVSLDCTDAGCTDETLDVSVQWTGTGPLARHSSTSDDDDGTCRSSSSFKSTNRSATAAGTLNATAYTATELVIPPSLFTSQVQYSSRGCGDTPNFTPPQAATTQTATPIFRAG